MRKQLAFVEEKFINQLFSDYQKASDCPQPAAVVHLFESILHILYPELSRLTFHDIDQFKGHIQDVKSELHEIIQKDTCDQPTIKDVTSSFMNSLPSIKLMLDEDIEALFAGDPAAKSKTEVIRTYPGFFAIAAHRIAHQFSLFNLELIPRIISEYAHSKTGIDIHPSATIGKSFCIDHGTGVVIGETTLIGNHVKIYQGVTLGALSVKKEDAKTKRHPTIEDNVVIYSGATILGGKTVIGRDSIIGGNVWITESVPQKSRLTYVENQKINQRIENH
ncbi:serine O-acetyltransferase [Fulvivirga lutea]|uniref:serine O-acetyltransferase n=1 Tax=Fulvivirga lutea TaxID=2810512 RepID=UPI001F31A29B|nr:serine acetyltransferase [Fulvivirga lutea]